MIGESNAETGQYTITPYFTVQYADRLIDFLVAAFVQPWSEKADTAITAFTIQHARLLIGNSLIMVNESTADYPKNVSQMHVIVVDADKAYQSALQLGATTLMEPNDRPHGERMAGITDPCGNIWWIASPNP